MSIKKLYEGLGNNKAQRFRRFFLICMLIASVIMYGFYKESIHISFSKTFGAVQTDGEN